MLSVLPPFLFFLQACPPGWACLKRLTQYASKRHFNQMPESPQLVHFDATLLWVPSDWSVRGDSSHLHSLHPQSLSSSHYPELVTTDEASDVDQPTNRQPCFSSVSVFFHSLPTLEQDPVVLKLLHFGAPPYSIWDPQPQTWRCEPLEFELVKPTELHHPQKAKIKSRSHQSRHPPLLSA